LTNVGFTSFQNAQLIFLLPYAVITVSLVTALFPRMSSAMNERDSQKLRNHLNLGLTGILATLLPASLVLFITAPLLTVTLFARGASSVAEALATGQIVQAFCFGILPFSIFYLLLRVFYANENTATPFWLNLGLNIIAVAGAISLFFYLPVELKVIGLAAAMSFSYLIIAAVTVFVVRRKIGGLGAKKLVATTARSLVATALAGLACWLVLRSIAPENTQDLARNLIALCLSVASAALVLLVTWRIFGVKNLASLVRPPESPTGRN
jgi:putative peptidoglycan lipid II flippase